MFLLWFYILITLFFHIASITCLRCVYSLFLLSIHMHRTASPKTSLGQVNKWSNFFNVLISTYIYLSQYICLA